MGNPLLDALPPEARMRMAPQMRRVHLPADKVLYNIGTPIDRLYFPIDCLVSLRLELEDGDSCEAAMVGHEGVTGYASLMGGEVATFRTIVLVAGDALQIPAEWAKGEFGRNHSWRRLVLLYVQDLITQISLAAPCNRHHCIHQRVSRWLLMALDRLPTHHIKVTQDLLASSLGVRREGVSAAANQLHDEGAIEYSRGVITVRNRAALEHASCECYKVLRNEAVRLSSCRADPRRIHLDQWAGSACNDGLWQDGRTPFSRAAAASKK